MNNWLSGLDHTTPHIKNFPFQKTLQLPSSGLMTWGLVALIQL
jgi:hypothetical protein